MDRTERFYKIDQLLQTRRPVVPVREFLAELGISLATFKRDLEYMRERLNAPIVWDRDLNGYRFEEQRAKGPKYELPGLWFNPQEAQALLTMEHLIEEMEPSLLGPHLAPLRTRLTALLSSGDHASRYQLAR
jgi:predicted DNA-binding transcriptional regulator YafY